MTADELRALPYQEYLRTHHWSVIRQAALDHYGEACIMCGDEAAEVHHRTYARIGRERIHDLTVLCRLCHAKHHEKPIDDIPFGIPHWDDLDGIRRHFERIINEERAA